MPPIVANDVGRSNAWQAGLVPRTLVAGIDSSTQSCKVLIKDVGSGELVRSGRAPHPEGTEIDPESWWESLGTAAAAAGGLDDVAAISVAGQQHGMVLLDSQGHVVRKALLWNDTRSAQAAADLVDELGAGLWASRVGLVPVASFTGPKLRWLRDAEPNSAARVAAVALPHDWLSWRLRGYGPIDQSPLGPDLEALATDGSDASGTAYWDPITRTYDEALFKHVSGMSMRVAQSSRASRYAVVVPRIVGPAARMGTLGMPIVLPGDSVLPAGTVVASGAGDNAAAALGLGLTRGDVAVSLGTSGTVFAVSDHATPDPTGTVAGFADATGARLPIVTTLNAARVLDVIGGLLGVDHDQLGQLALRAPAGSDGLVLIPYFIGERTPNRPTATATLAGMTPATTTREHVARAAIEGMLCSLAEGLAALERTGVETKRILLIGGAAKNDAVCAVAPQVFGAEITLPEPDEYVAVGAARQASWALTGILPDWTVPQRTIAADPRPEVLAAYRASAG